MKRVFLTMAAMVVMSLSLAQEYIVLKNINGQTERFDIATLESIYFEKYEATGTGTQDNPFNVAAAVAKCKEIGASFSIEEMYYVKGIVAETRSVSASEAAYGNITFNMVDEIGSANTFLAYQVMGSYGTKLKEGFTVTQGDEVVIYGPIYNYNGKTPETAGKGAAVIVTINGHKTTVGDGPGAGDTPINSGKLEFPAAKGGNSIVVTHMAALNDNTGLTETNYSIEWDTNIRAQRWCCYKMYNTTNKKNVTRYYANNDGSLSSTCQYPNDPDLPEAYRLTIDPYITSGYDHGHICASADRMCSTASNYQTFFITNMQPQKNAFNAGIWASMETKVRAWATQFDTLYVCKGGTIDQADHIIEYVCKSSHQSTRVNENHVPVPRYFFMAVLGRTGNNLKATGFWINQEDNSSTSLIDYAVTIADLQEKTGIDFFCNLPDDIESSIENVSISQMQSEWSW